MKRITKLLGMLIAAFAIGTVIFSAGPSAHAGGGYHGPKFTRASVPPGFDQYLVFIADGELPANPGIVLLGDDSFQTDTMGRSPAEIAAFIADTVQFFDQKFGIPNADNNPDISFFPYTTNSAMNYRAYVVGKQKVPRGGWEVRDGGFMALVTNPNGITLGGDFAGLHVPVNSNVVVGEYNIKRTKLNGQPKTPLVIKYFANIPNIGPPFAGAPSILDCALESAQFGNGLAQGFVGLTDIGGGNINANVRNVLTFSSAGGL